MQELINKHLSALQRSPADEKPFRELENLFVGAARWEDLLRLYEGRAKALPDSAAAPLMLSRAGDLLRLRMNNPARAEELYRSALVARQNDPGALEGLKVLFESKGDLTAVSDVLERRAAALPAREASGVWLELGQVYERLNRRDRAVIAYQRAWRGDFTRRDALQRAFANLFALERFRMAVDVLDDLRARFGSEGLASQYVAVAEKLLDFPSEHPLALRAANTALSIDANDAGAKKVRDALANYKSQWKDRIKALKSEANDERDARRKAGLFLSISLIHANFDVESDGRKKAREFLDKSLLLKPGMPAALDALERMASENGDWKGLEGFFEKMANSCKERTAAVEILLRLATLRVVRFGDRSGALVALLKAAQLDPARPEVCGLAVDFLLDEGRSQDAAALLERHIEALPERRAQVAMRLRLAEMLESRLNDRPGARAQLEAALHADPACLEAAQRLAPFYEGANDLARQAEVLEISLPLIADQAEKAAVLVKVAGLLGDKLGRHQDAVRVLARALVLAPGRAEIRAALERHAKEADAPDTVVSAFRVAAELAGPEHRLIYVRRIAQLLDVPLGRLTESVEAWKQVLALAPGDSQASENLESLLARTGAHKELLEGFEQQLAATADKAEQRALLEKMARAAEQGGSDPNTAAQLYQRQLALDPDDRDALKRLGAVSAALEKWADVAEITRKLASLAKEPAEAREWRSRLAQVLSDRLGKKEEAAELFLALLAEEPGRAELLPALEKIAAAGVMSRSIAEATLPLHQASGDHGRAADAMQLLITGTDDPSRKMSLYFELAEVYEEKLADRRAAYTCMEKAFRLSPASPAAREELERLAQELAAQAEVASVYMETAEPLADKQLAGILLVRSAELAEAVAEYDLGGQALERALALPGAGAGPARALHRMAAKAERWADCERAIKLRLTLEPAVEAVLLLPELATVCERLGKPKDAAAALEEAIARGGNQAELLPRLSKLYEQAGEVGALRSSITRELELAEAAGEKDKAARLRLKLSKLLEGSSDRGQAVANYAAVLATRPSDPEALAALERLLQDPDSSLAAAQALAPAYEATKEYRKLVHALELMAEGAPDAAEKVQVLKKAAQIHAVNLRQLPLAFATLARALRLTPLDAQLRVATRKAAEECGELSTYAEVLSELADGARAEKAIPLLRELAEVSERKLGQREQAIAYYRKMLDAEPDNIDGLRGLHRLCRLAEHWEELAGACQRLSSAIYDEQEKAQLLREAGSLYENVLDQPDQSASCYRALSELEPLDRDSALALDRLYQKLQRPADLAYALELRRSQEGNSAAGREAAFRLAELKRNQINDPNGALQLYAKILADDPSHAGARGALENLAKSAQQGSAEALKLLDPVLERAGEHPRRVAMREARLANAAGAEREALFAEIRQIYERDMGRAELAFLAACRSFQDGVDREKVAPEMERLARDSGSFEELAEVYEQVAEGALPGDEWGQRSLRRAAQLRAQLGENERAVGLLKDLLVEVPGDREALEALAKLHERSQNARELADVYKAQAAQAQDPAQRAQLLLQAGQAKMQMGEDAQAAELGRAVLALSPKNRPALELLDRAFERMKMPREQADALRTLAELAEDPPARRALLLKRASLLEKEGEAVEAVDAYARVLSESPGETLAVAGLERLFQKEQARPVAAKVLEPFYRSIDDGRHLCDVLEVKAAQSSKEERLPLLQEIARLRESLGQRPLAFAAMLRCFRDDPESKPVRDEMERLAAETGAFEELAAAYEDELEREPSAALELELWRRLGSIFGDRLGRPDRSAQALEEVFRRQPDDPSVLEVLAQIYRRASSLRELSQVLWRQVSFAQDPARKRELLMELALLLEEKLQDQEGAVGAWKEIRKLDPADPQAIPALARLFAETNRHEEQAELLLARIGLVEQQGKSEESLELQVELGRLKLTRLGDPRGALTAFTDVLAKRPGHPGAVAALEEMARGEGALRAEAALALEPVFSGANDYLRLVQVLDARAQAAPPLEKSSLLRRIAGLYAGPLANPEMAFVYATRGLEAAPDDPEALASCLALAQQAGAQEELAEHLADMVDRARTDEARVALQRALARLLSATAEQAEPALRAWRRLLELAPADIEALDGLADLYREGGHWDELLEVFRKQLAAANAPGQRAELLRRIGELQDERLSDYNGAIGTLRRLLELSPEELPALERLDRLCQRAERWAELADCLAKQIELAARDGKRDLELTLKFRLAQVRESRLLDRSGAMALYREVLTERPGHAEAVARLEAVVAREPTYDEASDILADAFRAQANHGKLAKLLEDRAAAVGEGDRRKRYLAELARIRAEHLERPDLAFLALYKAFHEDPTDAEVRKSLERAAEAAETHEELASLYEEELPRLSGPDAGEVCFKLAQLNEQNQFDSEWTSRAIEYYEKARAFDPAKAPQALTALDRLYRELEDWARLADVLGALVELSEDPAEKTALLFRLGQLAQDKLNPPSPDRAARAFEQILLVDAVHLPAARALEKLYEAVNRHDRLFAVLELQASQAAGPEKERLASRMAEVAANGLGDSAKAIELYRQVMTANPRAEAAFAALESLYEQTGKTEELCELLRERLAITVDPREITRLSEKLGRARDSLGKQDEAVAAFQAALERDPRNRRALDALREIYERGGPSDELAGVLRRLIPLADDAAGVKVIRLRLAEVLSALGRREEAIESARRAIELEPHQPEELLRAEELFRQLSDFPDQIRAMEARAELLHTRGQGAEAAAVLYAVAEVHAGPLGRREAAASTYEHLLEFAPTERQAFDALREIYSATNDWRRYAAVCEKFLPSSQTPGERVDILKDLGAVQEQRLGLKEVAFLSYCRAFEAAPSEEDVRQAMERLAEENGSFEELATVYETVVEDQEKGPLSERLYLALARIHDEKLDQAEEAEGALRKVLEFDPANRAALESLAKMFSRRGRDTEYVVSLEQKLEAAASIEERKSILREIALTYDTRLKNPEEAAAAWLRSIQLEADRETFRTLADLYRREKKPQEAAETLIRARDFESEPQLRSRLQGEVAEIYERELSDDEAAVAGYRLALEFDPENRDGLAALERLYTKLDRPAELLGVYDAQLRVADDTRERVKILFKTAGIWEDKYQNLENADACLEAVLAVDPDNLQAIKGLERLRRLDAETRNLPARWEDLLRAYDRHLSLKPEVSEQVELLVAMGEVQHQHLKRTDKAAQLFHWALELDPRSRQAMHALGLLYERSGNWPFALDMLTKEAELLGASREAVELFHRIGKINEEMLLDQPAAKQSYLKALQIEPSYLPTIRSLKGIYEGEKDWDRYLQTLVQEAESTPDLGERAQAWLQVARFHADSREDRDSAAKAYEEALKLVPDLLEAARPLADIYVAAEQWEGAEKMLDIVGAHLSEQAARDPKVAADLCRQMYRLGYVCEKMKKSERALGAYERAYQLDSTYLPSAEGYANLLVAHNRLPDALAVYQAILIHHREDLTDLEVVEYYWQIGDLYKKQGQLDRAQKEFEKALAIDGSHEPSLRAQIELFETKSDFERAVELRARMVDLLEDGPRFEMLLAIGKTAQEKLKDAYRAIDAYSEALKITADSAEVLEALVALFRETRQGTKAVDALEKLLALPAVSGEAARAKKLYAQLGEILRDELKDIARAAEAFNKALDLDFRFLQAFSALESMLGANKQWDALEQNYLKMIQRLPKTDDTHAARMTLFKALAEFYEKVRRDKKATRQVYQVVIKGKPDDVQALERYAELCSEEEGAEKEAIEAWRAALPVTDKPAKAVHALVKLAAKAKDYDLAWLSAQVASFLLGDTGPEEREILGKLGAYAKRKEQAQKPLTNQLWTAQLYHPKVRGAMGDILALLYDKLGAYYAKKPSAFSIEPKFDRIDLATSQELALNSYKYVLRILDVDEVDLYSPFLVQTRERMRTKAAGMATPDRDLMLELIHTHPVALKAGGKLFGEQSQKELYFWLGRTVTFCRPELALARVLPAERLEAVFQAAVVAGVPSYRITADPRAVDAEMAIVNRLEPQFRAALARLAREYARGATPNDVRDFVEGAELTANRAGALLCADLEVAKAVLSRDAAAKVNQRARVRDLVLFCLSKDYLELRSATGLKIEIKLPGAGR